MTVKHFEYALTSDARKPMFHDVTVHVKQSVQDSGIHNGVVVVYSPHTTCSVIIQEESHDELHDGTKYIFQDLIEALAKTIPACSREGDYLHPGQAHLDHATGNLDEKAVWSLNTDAHLRSCLIGRSESIPVVEGELQLGEFGEIYFADFDAVRTRDRVCQVQIIGE